MELENHKRPLKTPAKGLMLPVTLSEFKKAIQRLEEAIDQEKNDFIRDSVIQRFEFSVELGWKTAKKIMGTSTSAPKDVVREMAQNKYIKDVNKCLTAIDMRNRSSYTYREDIAEKVYNFAISFLPELKYLESQLNKK
ncbi:MAG: nucleotidyltransferase [Bdellovibrio sp.]|nr:MAG: nucleotidyltransferase [Bdellovibrio sp.]